MRAKALQYAAAALTDLADIRKFLSEAASRPVAARMVERIRRRVRLIAESPLAGTPRPEYQPHCRFAVERPYVIYYAFEADVVTVLRVLHQARDRDDVMQS